MNLVILHDNGCNDLKGLNFRISNDIFTHDEVTLENMQCCQLQAAQVHLNVKESRNGPGVAQRVPGVLGSQIS